MQQKNTHLHDLISQHGQGVTALNISIYLWNQEDKNRAEEYFKERIRKKDCSQYYFVFLIQMLCWRNARDEAEKLLNRLTSGTSLTLSNVVGRITKKYAQVEHVESEYVIFPDSSMQNIGFWLHTFRDKVTGKPLKKITKLSTNELLGVEYRIAKTLSNNVPAWRDAVPEIQDAIFEAGTDLCAITMDFVEGNSLEVNRLEDDQIDDFVKTYSACTDSVIETSELLQLLDGKFEIGLSHAFLVSAFQKIHDPKIYIEIMQWLKKMVSTRGYQPNIVSAVEVIVERMLSSNFCGMIEPEKHYSVLHGDLHRKNILCQTDQYWIIDWGKASYGPRAIDLATLFRRYPYDRIRSIVKRNSIFKNTGGVEDVLFCLALVTVSVMIDIPEIKNEPADQLFVPACNRINHLLSELNVEWYGC